MPIFRRSPGSLLIGDEALAIVLTASLLEWLRALPVRRTLHTLKLMARLLRTHADRIWPVRLEGPSADLRSAHDAADRDRLTRLMQDVLLCFDGPGSLRDLALSRENGHRIKAEEVEAANSRLGALRTQLYLSARQTLARLAWQSRRPHA